MPHLSRDKPTRGEWDRNGNGQPTPYEALIRAEQVKQLYAVVPVGCIASYVNSLIVFFIIREVISYPIMAAWLAAVWAVATLRLALYMRFRRATFAPEAAPLWQKRFLVTLALAGISWGCIGLVPLAGVSLAYQVFLVFVLGGMAAGASAAFSAVRTGYAAFSVPALAPIFIQFLLLDDLFHYAMAAMLLLFSGLIWLISLHNFTLNRTSLLLRFENLDVIDRLKASMAHAEELNAQLIAGIDAKRRAEDELKEYQQHLERVVEERTADLKVANKELEQFAYVASHDLKAPLRAIANLALAVSEDAAGRLDEENRERLDMLRARAQRMDTLIEGMLAYARLGKPSPGATEVALDEVLSEIESELPLPAGFVVEWEAPLPHLKADRTHVRQIFQNLIANAVHHHDRPAGHVGIRADDAGGHWLLEVADDGPGIPEEDRKQLFRMFATGSSKDERTGIGLAVVRKLVRGYGGQVEVAANRPRGTVFRIIWPKTPPLPRSDKQPAVNAG